MKGYSLSISLSAAVLAVLMAACVPAGPSIPTPLPPTATPVPATATPEPPAAAQPGFPLTLTDDMGRQVTLPAVPERIVSLAPSNTEILFAVGAGDQVVGVTQYCNYPVEAQSREQIGGFSAQTISVEKIVALEPDLVVAAGPIHQPVIEALEALAIPVLAVNPNTLEQVYTSIELVGHLTGHDEQAAQVVEEMKSRVALVSERLATLPEEQRLRVYWEVFDEPRMTAGPTTFNGQLIELAGGVNVFADVTEEYPQINDEEVIRRNPAVIMGADTMGEKLTTELVAQRPGWDQIDAVRNGRIYLFNGDMVARAGPRLALVLEEMAKAMYPELFE